ncbi:MAG: hypothetical protein IJ325_02555 [Clostridia bacterium]|nr:hypothetical protein [Clostridia bacterium]
MNTDLIFDAMDYIDDDMLEDVDALRAKKKANPNRIWVRYASVAACLCIIIGAVYLLDRTGMIDTSEVADELAQENEVSGESLVHRYVRADIITSDNTTLSVTAPQKITAIYDILRTELKSEAAADDKLYIENDKEPVGEKTDGTVAPENAGGVIAQPEYTIALVSADGTKTVYTLVGKVVHNEATGETFSLNSNQYNELMEILNQK